MVKPHEGLTFLRCRIGSQGALQTALSQSPKVPKGSKGETPPFIPPWKPPLFAFGLLGSSQREKKREDEKLCRNGLEGASRSLFTAIFGILADKSRKTTTWGSLWMAFGPSGGSIWSLWGALGVSLGSVGGLSGSSWSLQGVIWEAIS